jgi:hypothetical protein
MVKKIGVVGLSLGNIIKIMRMLIQKGILRSMQLGSSMSANLL